MTDYYGFNSRTYSNVQPIDNQQAILTTQFPTSLKSEMKKALDVEPLNDFKPCCSRPGPCLTHIQHRPQFAGCGPTFVSWNELNDQHPEYQLTRPIQDPAYYNRDLNQTMYERHLMYGNNWWPEGTQPHRNARQLFVQYIMGTKYPRGSSHEKPIERVEDSLRYIQQKFGKPQYFSF